MIVDRNLDLFGEKGIKPVQKADANTASRWWRDRQEDRANHRWAAPTHGAVLLGMFKRVPFQARILVVWWKAPCVSQRREFLGRQTPKTGISTEVVTGGDRRVAGHLYFNQ